MHLALIAFFFALFATQVLGMEVNIAPGLSTKNALLYVLFGALAITMAIKRNRRIELLWVFIPFFFYFAYALFTWIVAWLVIDYPGYEPRTGLMTLKSGLLDHLLIFFLFFFGVTDARRAAQVFRSMAWIIMLTSALVILDAFNILSLGLVDERDDGRVSIGNANEFAALLAVFLPAIIMIYWQETGWRKWLAGIGVVVTGFAFLMPMSRGAIVGVVVGSMLAAYYLRSFVSPRAVINTAVGAALFFFVAVLIGMATGYSDTLMERFQFGVTGAAGFDATSGRTMIWEKAIEMMLEHPVSFVTGFGWHVYSISTPSGFAAHNTYLHLLYDLGVIGVALFLLIVGSVLGAVRNRLHSVSAEVQPLLISFVFGFLALLVTIFFTELFHPWLYIWAFAGVSLRLALAEPGDDSVNMQLSPSEPLLPRSHASRRVGSVR